MPRVCGKRSSARYHPLPMSRFRLFLVCLCQACTAFVVVPATARLPLGRAKQSVLRPCAPTPATATARPPAAAPGGQTTRSIGRRKPLCSSPIGGIGKGNLAGGAAAGAAPEDDPFRPERASVSPMVINAIVSVLFKHETVAEEAATAALEQRRTSGDWRLTEEEERAVTSRVYGVATSLTELRFMLATAVSRTPSIAKYGMLADYGMSDDVEDNPLEQMNQAECLLALYMLHKEKSGVAAVDFLDAERLEVLKG